MILRLLNPQGIAGLAASLCLALLLILQKGETRHWRKQSAGFEELYRDEQSARLATVANYRAAADQARREDAANLARVAAEQRTINERTADDFEDRIAAARAAAQRLRVAAPAATADSGTGGATHMPDVPAAASSADRAASEDGLSRSDALIATEQAIQLDELIEWVKAQAAIDPNR